MATSEQLDQLRQDLQSENDDLRTQLVDLRQSLQVNMPHHENEDNMDIIVNSHMRDITADNRPQMSGAGLEVNNKHFRDLSNHELHQIKKIHEKDHKQKPRTVLDENLGETRFPDKDRLLTEKPEQLVHADIAKLKAFMQAQLDDDD